MPHREGSLLSLKVTADSLGGHTMDKGATAPSQRCPGFTAPPTTKSARHCLAYSPSPPKVLERREHTDARQSAPHRTAVRGPPATCCPPGTGPGASVHPAPPNSRGDGHEELVKATEEHDGRIAQPDVARAGQEEDQPGLHRRHDPDDQLRPQGPADLHKAGGKGGEGTWGDRARHCCVLRGGGRGAGRGAGLRAYLATWRRRPPRRCRPPWSLG